MSHKLRDMYLPTLKANFMVWPAVQMINFRIMPIQFQLVSYIPKSVHGSCVDFEYSLLYQQLVSPGLHISLYPMLLKMQWMLGQHLNRPISVYYD